MTHVAQQLKTPGGESPRESLEILKPDVPFGVPLCQFAALGSMPGIDEATTHIIEVVANMDLQVSSFILFAHNLSLLANRTAALKSSINSSGLSKQ